MTSHPASICYETEHSNLKCLSGCSDLPTRDPISESYLLVFGKERAVRPYPPSSSPSLSDCLSFISPPLKIRSQSYTHIHTQGRALLPSPELSATEELQSRGGPQDRNLRTHHIECELLFTNETGFIFKL